MIGAYPGAMDVAEVAKGREFNSGGQGTVWAVEHRTINGTWPVAYKEYHARIRADLKPEVLSEMVGFIPSLPRDTGRWLAECTAWPAVLVTDSAGVSGFLMRQIPERFFRRFAFAPNTSQPAGFQYLLNPPAYFRRAGFDITPRQRFELLLDFARTLVRLHSLGVVVGDMSPNNVLFCLDGPPSCFLIDCDAMALRGTWALPAVETPNWGLPPGERMGGPGGDSYKFGLLAARLFAGEQDGRNLTALRGADPAVGRLAEQSLSTNPALRPALDQWLNALAGAVKTAPATLPQPTQPQTQPRATQSQTHVPTVTAPVPQGAGPPQQPPPTVPNAPFVPPFSPYPLRPAPRGQNKHRARRWLVSIVLLFVALQYGPALYGAIEKGAGSGTSDQSGQSGQSDPSDLGGGSDVSDPAAQDSAEGQARALNDLLERNAGNRSDVGTAVGRLTSCPGRSGLRSAKGVFADAASERDGLVRDLKALDPDQLSTSMTTDLTSGWQASADADRAYARLAEKMMSSCTSKAVVSSAQWSEASKANVRATDAKKDFVSAWNPVAEKYGLTTLTWDEV